MAEPTTAGSEHVSVWYRTPQECLGHVLREVGDGLAAGDALLVSVPEATWAAAMPALGAGADRVSWVPAEHLYQNPVQAMGHLAGFVERSLAGSASRIRAVGHIPVSGGGLPDRWLRYEGAVSDLFVEAPLRAVCLLDAARAEPSVLDAVTAVHRQVDDGGGPCPSPCFDPAGTCRRLATPAPGRTPDVVRDGPSAAAGRLAATDVASGLLGRDRMADLHLVVTELVTNAQRHGGPGVELRLWREADGVTVAVTDAGPGIADPFAGLRPSRIVNGGRGLWLVGHLCDELGWSVDGGRHTVVTQLRA